MPLTIFCVNAYVPNSNTNTVVADHCNWNESGLDASKQSQSSIWNNPLTAFWSSFNNVGNEFYKHFHTYECTITHTGQSHTWGSMARMAGTTQV